MIALLLAVHLAAETVTPHVVRALYFDLLSQSPFERELTAAQRKSFEVIHGVSRRPPTERMTHALAVRVRRQVCDGSLDPLDCRRAGSSIVSIPRP